MSRVTTPVLVEASDHTRGFRRIVALLVSLVTVPTVLLLAVGVLMLVFYEVNLNLVFGILVLTLVAATVTGVILALVFLRREARLSQLQSDFVSKVSHELRTPLTSIRMFTETLQLDRISPEQRAEVIEALAVETGRLSERIERLLDWGRMEAGRRSYELSPDDPEAVVQSALEAFRTSTMRRDIPVVTSVEPGLPTVRVDRGAMVDAILNLLSNAHKYGGDAPAPIRLEAARSRQGVRISVSDEGIGIPRAEHRRIFQKFYRADERLSRAAEGTGLGLAIVRHVVRGHGGHIEVTSEPGRGSTFSIYLPAARAPGAKAEKEARS